MRQVSMKLTRLLDHSIKQRLISCGTCILFVCVMLPGCLSTPQYLRPGGYSSTYRKALIRDSLTPQPSATAGADLPATIDQRLANAKSEEKR